MPAPHSIIGQLHIDFFSRFKIEKTDIHVTVSWQYFSDKEEFENRIAALVRLAGKNNPRPVYGVILINVDNPDDTKPPKRAAKQNIEKFENFLIKNIRVSRIYTLPGAPKHKRRKTDNPNCTLIKGNFDLACSTPSTATQPHRLEFILYGCAFWNALKKKKVLKDYARDIGQSIDISITRYTGQDLATSPGSPFSG